jgi:hypothetical protein
MKRNLLVTLFIIVLMVLFDKPVKAGELEKLLGNKEVEYNGVCLINAKSELVFKEEDTKGKQLCIVGYDKKTDGNNRFVLMIVNNKPHRLIKLNIKTKKQEVIWRNPDGMV